MLSLETGSAGTSSLPEDLVGRQGFVALDSYFPAGARSNPAVVDADGSSSAVCSAAQRLENLVADDDSSGTSAV